MILSRFLKLTVKILYPGFLASIINGATAILAIFKHTLKTPGFITFDSAKVEVKAGDIWEDSDLPNPKIITRLDFDE